MRSRGVALLGGISMYRLALYALGVLGVIALVLSFVGLAGPSPLELVASAAVLVVLCAVTDAAAQRLLHLPWRVESSLITAGVLLFVLQPSLRPGAVVGLALAAVLASASKYVLAWRGRHVFNPAAVGAASVTLLSTIPGLSMLGTSSWWIGVPQFGPVVLLVGVVVLWRTEKLGVIGLFWATALVVGVVVTAVEVPGQSILVIIGQELWSSPILFLGAFLLSEPLTLPPRRHQQLAVALVVGVLVGWAPLIGGYPVSVGAERAVLVGNLLAFVLAVRTAVRLVFDGRRTITPTVLELTFHATGSLSFASGQFLELEVPHRHPDSRGTRREFSIASAPDDLPEVRIAFRAGSQSSFKKALAAVEPGRALPVTGVWGDFLLPRRPDSPVLMVAAGIGVTPFVSQLRHLAARGDVRDVVLVYVASDAAELAFRADIEQAGVPVVVFTRDEPADLPENWRWAQGVRLDAAGLARAVPDIARRHAYVSGPAGLIADLAPALAQAKSLTTDAFSGY